MIHGTALFDLTAPAAEPVVPVASAAVDLPATSTPDCRPGVSAGPDRRHVGRPAPGNRPAPTAPGDRPALVVASAVVTPSSDGPGPTPALASVPVSVVSLRPPIRRRRPPTATASGRVRFAVEPAGVGPPARRQHRPVRPLPGVARGLAGSLRVRAVSRSPFLAGRSGPGGYAFPAAGVPYARAESARNLAGRVRRGRAGAERRRLRRHRHRSTDAAGRRPGGRAAGPCGSAAADFGAGADPIGHVHLSSSAMMRRSTPTSPAHPARETRVAGGPACHASAPPWGFRSHRAG